MIPVYYARYVPDENAIRKNTETEHMLGRKLLFKGLKKLYGISVSEGTAESLLAFTDSGKPYLPGYPGIHFNITHTAGLAACAFYHDELGIDAEAIGYFPETLIQTALDESEKDYVIRAGEDKPLREERFWRLWTLKEAYGKMMGTGADRNLKAPFFVISENFKTPDYSEGQDNPRITCSEPGICCSQFLLESRFVLSICRKKSSDGPEDDEKIRPEEILL